MVVAHALPDVPPPGEVRYIVRQPQNAPPGGWCYKQAETAREWSGGGSLDRLAQEVTAHRMHNGLPQGDARGDVMHFTGAMLVDAGRAALVDIHQPVNRLIDDYWRGIKAFKTILQFQGLGRPLFVSIPAARERAEVCHACPKNVTNTAEGALQRFTNEQMRGLVGGREMGLEGELGTCLVCTCEAATLVHFTSEFLVASGHFKNLRKYPANCWKHRAHKP